MLDTNYGEFSKHSKINVYWKELKLKIEVDDGSTFSVCPLTAKENQ